MNLHHRQDTFHHCTLVDLGTTMMYCLQSGTALLIHTLYFNDSVRICTVWYIWYYITNRVTNTFTSAIYQILVPQSSIAITEILSTVCVPRTQTIQRKPFVLILQGHTLRPPLLSQFFDVYFWGFLLVRCDFALEVHYGTEDLSFFPHRCWRAKGPPLVPGRDSNRGPTLRRANPSTPSLNYATLHWATPHPTQLRHTPIPATPHPTELSHTPIWATPLPYELLYYTLPPMSYATPQWATPQPNGQCHTPISYATTQWATPHPNPSYNTLNLSNTTPQSELRQTSIYQYNVHVQKELYGLGMLD